MKKLTILLMCVSLLISCAGLILNDNDSFGKKTAKVTTRIGVGVLTIGVSELLIADIQMAKALEYAEQQTQIAFDRLIFATINPDTPENELTALHMEYQNKLRQEQILRGEYKRFQDAASEAIVQSGESIGNGIKNGLAPADKSINVYIYE